AASLDTRAALRVAARATGLVPLRAVPATALPQSRFDALALRLLERDYPAEAQREDSTLYQALGLGGRLADELAASAHGERALYDPRARHLYVRGATAGGPAVVDAAARALADQHYGLGRLIGLRVRDRDAAAAAALALP